MPVWPHWGEETARRLLLGSAVFLSLILAFFSGVFFEKGRTQEEALIVRIPEYAPAPVAPSGAGGQLPGLEPAAGRPPADSSPASGKADCQFVGSKNSNKYHLPTCAPAKRIKPENLRCFKDATDAQSQGYVPGCLQ